MAEGFLRHYAAEGEAEVFSAGTHPEKEVNPLAVKVMAEAGIDIRGQKPEKVDDYLNGHFDWVITVCDHAKETCPVFTGRVANMLHMGYEDPAKATGTIEEQLKVYRKVRDQINDGFRKFYNEMIE
jgi:arsenate reductase